MSLKLGAGLKSEESSALDDCQHADSMSLSMGSDF